MQRELHESIFHPLWGIKSKTTVDERIRRNFLTYTDCLVSRGAQAIILGCTEIPLALPDPSIHGIPLIDPLKIVARALIREAAPHKLKGDHIPLEKTATA